MDQTPSITQTIIVLVKDEPMRAVLEAALGFYCPGAAVVFCARRDDVPLKQAAAGGPAILLSDEAIEGADFPGLAVILLGTKPFQAPFRLGLLVDRISRQFATQKSGAQDPVAIGPHRLEPQANRLILAGADEEIHLTEKERDILLLLAARAGAIVPRDQLLDEVWGYGVDKNIETHTLETHIYRLRQKIERDPAVPNILLTEEQGYRLKND